jgi:hypothetical protein
MTSEENLERFQRTIQAWMYREGEWQPEVAGAEDVVATVTPVAEADGATLWAT